MGFQDKCQTVTNLGSSSRLGRCGQVYKAPMVSMLSEHLNLSEASAVVAGL
ncbi:hypothetical protein DPMN_020424 [Dreissena polymorpha]|uniref:Uncharacterized protein n=1 Tax=Dreissena polymorpha TaxID=45954 RepID=A0A9D4SA72_DREPO|nr:hypothetical protein DPMN_020424 [Dreissena polymorpha]